MSRAERHFGSALMERSKTDPLDAHVLAEYAAQMPSHNGPPHSPTALKLMAVAPRLEALTEMIAAEKNRLPAASLSEPLPGYVRLEIARHLRAIYEHLLASGKTKMRALVAPMRKLLHAFYGIFKHDQVFDGAKVYAATDTALAPAPSNSEVACVQA